MEVRFDETGNVAASDETVLLGAAEEVGDAEEGEGDEEEVVDDAPNEEPNEEPSEPVKDVVVLVGKPAEVEISVEESEEDRGA